MFPEGPGDKLNITDDSPKINRHLLNREPENGPLSMALQNHGNRITDHHGIHGHGAIHSQNLHSSSSRFIPVAAPAITSRPTAELPVKLTIEGAAELVGPDVVTAEGGMTGTYIRTIGAPGSAKLTVSTDQTETSTIEFIAR